MLNSTAGHELLQIRIPAPAHLQWSPGQHFFIRFWGLEFPHAFSSHPWTIASLPGEGKEHSVDLVLRVHGGITKTLAHRAQGKAGLVVGVWVDGPYGGVPGGMYIYDDIILFAGGSGTSACLYQIHQRACLDIDLQVPPLYYHSYLT
jgi:NAD(P)H-flavin reductase